MKIEDNLVEQKYSIIHIETTGISPKHGDEIIEIAIHQVNFSGEILDSYSSLVNINADYLSNDIHGISIKMLKKAPKFSEIIPDILFRLNNSTLIAHNWDYVKLFLESVLSEFELNLHGICTLELNRRVSENDYFTSLNQICSYYDIEEYDEYSSLNEAKQTAKLFSILKNLYLQQNSTESFLKKYCKPIEIKNCPPANNIFKHREDLAEIEGIQNSKFYNMLNRLATKPSLSIPIRQYLHVLDKALADRILTESEVDSLVDFAEYYKLSKKQVIDIHFEYLRRLIRIYLLDQILSNTELEDLNLVADMLCITRKELNKIIDFEKTQISITTPLQIENIRSLEGKTVCFSGHLHSKINGDRIDTSMAIQLASERGLIVKRIVSKKLDYLVIPSDSDFSLKARKNQKAVEHGVQIIEENIFWEMIAVEID
ncbi:MAG: exonuclease domain-containing protein [Marinifilaceae bacterium]|jgi:DNA polymerase-3 subunit epsilon|nr:exonuclease domain-containing protein [Marinifilaceae bacterium]